MCQPCNWGTSYGVAEQSGPSNPTSIDTAYTALFNDIVRDTDHPALALQAHLTSLYGSAYYDLLTFNNVLSSANTTLMALVLIPENKRPLVAVIIILAIHLGLIAFVTLNFSRGGSLSLLGNAWNALAQLQSKEIDYWVASADGCSDEEVEVLMKNKEQDRSIVRLEYGGACVPRLRQQTHTASGPTMMPETLSEGDFELAGLPPLPIAQAPDSKYNSRSTWKVVD